MTRRIWLALIAAFCALVMGATSASAAPAGCDILNDSRSMSGMDIWNRSGTYKRLYIGQNSLNYSGFANNLLKFAVPSNCSGRSQYSPPGAYPYNGGRAYYFSQPDLNLIILITCTI